MIDLNKIPTRSPDTLDKDDAREISRRRAERIGDLAQKLVADGNHAVLIVLQGMDASGKDGAMRRVFGEIPPYALRTVSFKKPTAKEQAHDFLWRVHQQVPAKGEIVIFNRSHYEDVLIQRVHNWIDDATVARRMEAINAFEKLLVEDNNTLILKFYLHISFEEQEKELMERVEETEKHYKHADGDWAEREHWEAYRDAYHQVLNNSAIPWHVVGTGQRYWRDYQMTDIVLTELEMLDLSWPPLKTNRDWPAINH